ncbi:hypothetical protein [Vibrio harveyi]|uniref:hypothetical protein n=1 Tax=Vibrio harveyi TaxID=669 RepID=UPI0025B1CBFB|nr:hypothetical protein [Vibrio harveyi]WJT11022.1 hypothetical protein PH545_28915 [Vibrio harveyi]
MSLFAKNQVRVVQLLRSLVQSKLEKVLSEGRGVAVTWCVGHLLELALPEDYDPKYKKWSIDHLPIIPETFQFKAKSSTRSQLKVIRDLLKKVKQDELLSQLMEIEKAKLLGAMFFVIVNTSAEMCSELGLLLLTHRHSKKHSLT